MKSEWMNYVWTLLLIAALLEARGFAILAGAGLIALAIYKIKGDS